MGINGIMFRIWSRIRLYCVLKAGKNMGFENFSSIIDSCGVDLFDQYTSISFSNMKGKDLRFYREKLKNQHAFQTYFTEKAVRNIDNKPKNSTLVLVDIGDSAGSHLKYLQELLKGKYADIHAISVNLDPAAIDKIRMGGGEAVLCRAEDYKPDNLEVDVYLSYEMVEHLHNPAIFFYRLAKSNNGKYMVVTVPYRKHSRVALNRSMDSDNENVISAENEHIFELCPNDLKKIVRHSGWRVREDEIYYQYPRKSFLAPIYKLLWDRFDFEGYYAMFLERDMSVADRYTDWEE